MKRRNDNLYERKVRIPLSDGSFKRKSFYDTDKRLLDIKIVEIQNQINKGTYVQDSDITFKHNGEKWLRIHTAKKEETTKESYGIYLKHAIGLLGDKKLQDIKPSDIQEAYNQFTEKDENGKPKHSNNSLKHLHFVVNASLEFAVEDKLIYDNPSRKFGKKIKIDDFESYVYTEEEFLELLKKVKGTEEELIIILAGGVGLRAGEICALKWFDISESTITVAKSRYRIKGKTGEKDPKSKNGKRIIYADSYIIKTIKNHPVQSEYVLCRSTGKPYRNDEIYHKFVDVLDKLSMPKTRLHDLRAFAATMLAYYNVDVKTAASILGHDPAIFLKKYVKVQERMKKEAAVKIGHIFKGAVVTNVVNGKKERTSDTT
ncbi:MAG: tyrosine-type recombinase/integrase [Phycisphaerae bacterium]|nr:tyrosine-type recombinase/integrase [Phycisphaerae bacterium]